MSETTKAPVKVEETRPRRWDPLELLTQMETEMERVWPDRWLPLMPFGRRVGRMMPTTTVWAPRVDVFEQNGTLVIKAELPGVDKQDIDVAVEDGDLIIRGERKTEHEVTEKAYYRMERSFGSFYRSLPLPEGVKPEQVVANYTDGILEVRVPKPVATTPEPTKIPIK